MLGQARYVPPEAQSAQDLYWMQKALDMAQEALEHEEVPVGCVFVRDGHMIAQARNRTNELANATRHAELEAIDEILQKIPPKDTRFGTAPHGGPPDDNPMLRTTLYVTIEPCLMCASALRQIGIQRVVFGAGNERFGGNGTVLPIHASKELPYNPPYESVGGYLREEAIMILRRFYMTENAKGTPSLLTSAPKPKTKARRVLKTEIYRTCYVTHRISARRVHAWLRTTGPSCTRYRSVSPSAERMREQPTAIVCSAACFSRWGLTSTISIATSEPVSATASHM